MTTAHEQGWTVFTDPGLDDAVAVVWFVQALREQAVPVSVVAVAGNVSADQAALNARRMLAEAGEVVPVFETSAYAQRFDPLPAVHGQDGLGDLELADSDSPAAPVSEAALHDQWLCLGSATVPAALLERHRPARLVVMGGRLEAEPNSPGPAGECNFDADNAAAAALAAGDAQVDVVPLDCTRALSVSPSEIESIARSGPPPAALRFLDRYVALAKADGRDGAPVHDLAAAVLALAPDHARWASVAVSQEGVLSAAPPPTHVRAALPTAGFRSAALRMFGSG